MTLTIDLRDGFENTAVVVRVDGREVCREAALNTRTQIGLAKRIEVDLGKPGGRPVDVEVELPASAELVQLAVDASSPCFVGVDVVAGKPRVQVRSEPFGYV